MKRIYLILAVLGTIVPYGFFTPFIMQNGIALRDFASLLFVNLPAGGFTADLLITSAVFWIWSHRESQIHGVKHWWLFVVLNLTVGLSCALPLFLYFRQGQVEQLPLTSRPGGPLAAVN
jgi:hypothetical protein